MFKELPPVIEIPTPLIRATLYALIAELVVILTVVACYAYVV